MAKVGFIMNEQTEGQIVEPNIYIYISTKILFISKVYSTLFII